MTHEEILKKYFKDKTFDGYFLTRDMFEAALKAMAEAVEIAKHEWYNDKANKFLSSNEADVITQNFVLKQKLAAKDREIESIKSDNEEWIKLYFDQKAESKSLVLQIKERDKEIAELKEKETKTIWVLTSMVNDYNQYGEYFISAFIKKPTEEELVKLLGEGSEYAKNILCGGGRTDGRNEWHNLKEIKP